MIKLARGLQMPLDAITRTFGIVGQRGTGKTSTAVALVEEIAPHAPFVVIDPTGAWYGLRSSKDGKGPGIGCVVLGGHNGEVPLEETAGQMVADLVIRDRYSLVLDLELMRKGRQIRFVADFLEALYHGSREATFVVIDEAQRFAPQNSRSLGGDLPRCTGAVEDLVKLGRRKGLGCAFVSQRPASIAKDVLEQAESIIVHRVTGPNDRKAIAAWFEAQGEPEDEKAALAALPRLKRGEAYVMSPGFLEVFGEFKIREKRTFDSSREPGVGEKVSEPRGRADVDLDALTERMAATIERAKAADPKQLQAEIRQLRKQLEERPTETQEVEVEKVVEIPVLANGAVDRLQDAIGAIREVGEHLVEAAGSVATELQRVNAPQQVRGVGHGSSRARPRRLPGRSAGAAAATAASPGRSERRPSENPAPSIDGDFAPKGVQLDILRALASFEQSLTHVQLGHLTGKKASGGYFRNMLGALRSAGMIDGPNEAITITAAGLDVIGGPQPAITTDEVLDIWRRSLKGLAREFFDLLVEAYPESLTTQDLAEATGKEAAGGYFRNMLGSLRSAKLVVNTSEGVAASDDLFIGAPV